MSPPTWRKRAACLGLDPDIFYPAAMDDPRIKEAKAVCAECPVREECLEDALGRREPDGIFGGHTEPERAGILKWRRIRGIGG